MQKEEEIQIPGCSLVYQIIDQWIVEECWPGLETTSKISVYS